MSVRNASPTRKQRFDAALKLAGQTFQDWCAKHEVSLPHVNYVLAGVRKPSAELDAAIDATIEKYLGASQPTAAAQ